MNQRRIKMITRLKLTSIMMLLAMVASVMPALALPTQALAATCYQAQFVADVTVPDGTQYTSGTAFTKTWRLKNIGTCAWTKSDSMIYDSGAQMGGPTSVPMLTATAVGATLDISVNLTAPNAAGHYIGYWKFKSSTGTVFGIGITANKSWWVDINVPSNNAGSVTLDFAATADKATWTSEAGGLTFPGTEGDAKASRSRKINRNMKAVLRVRSRPYSLCRRTSSMVSFKRNILLIRWTPVINSKLQWVVKLVQRPVMLPTVWTIK